MEKVLKEELFGALPEERVLQDYYTDGERLPSKIAVLDDDPTGTQTVHDVYVYTDWQKENLKEALLSKEPVFFILTNSRGLSRKETEALHREICGNMIAASRETGVDFTLISRSDSTLRGHFPLETRTLYETLKENGRELPDGEIIAPYFTEGGRYTANDIHYVQEGEWLVPAGETEFAKDTTFGYKNSDLKLWIREKDPNVGPEERIHSVSISDIREGGPSRVTEILRDVKDFERVIVNCVSDHDMEVFCAGLIKAMQEGKRFLFRTAAGLVRVLAKIRKTPLLEKAELRSGVSSGGLVIVGSHVKKSTLQLEKLLCQGNVVPVELPVKALSDPRTAAAEIEARSTEISKLLSEGRNVAAYTTRTVLRITEGNSEENLKLSMKVSDALVEIVRKLQVQPGFMVSKGGITSSEIGVHGLAIKRALVSGQILPGVPVWKTGAESRYPGMSYVIFPGNVGDEYALLEAVKKLEK